MSRLTRVGPAALGVCAAVWLAAILLAPRAIGSSERLVSLSGAAIYSAGRFICHQRPDRCFRIAGRPMPVCARCTGLYVAAAAGIPFALLIGWSLPADRARRLLILTALPTIVTWSIEYAGVAHFSNGVRAVCALPVGFAAAWLVAGTLRHERPL
jgi:uncharacterized membrane protein